MVKTSEMVKRAMDAIAPGCHSEICSDEDRYEIEMMARRAIGAMREPTEEMKESAHRLDPHHYGRGDALFIWRAMIDAAL